MTFVIADYSGMELRGIAALADDAAMNADFANNVDLHRRQAAETLGIPQEEVTAQQRDQPNRFHSELSTGQVHAG